MPVADFQPVSILRAAIVTLSREHSNFVKRVTILAGLRKMPFIMEPGRYDFKNKICGIDDEPMRRLV